MAIPEQKKANLRMAIILASIAVAFFIGFMVKMAWLH
ncbi:cytochrome oxidase small assembly protein [Acidovorax sp. NCPPB 3859]|nr:MULTISPECIES: cytochrome oxidase small assembly protein [unclassified Acidovorax]MDA8448358.1 cytochrome oxidase small assembly protein [Acidovorax sp. GBBC 3297]MDA8457675.1 cytochrome oxidase small assembly protein [Acidovorax sp. GBBC 3333]MDA8462801.1 cytochrome oxidase small assembly protein [Acidovorax sp. GBBC 3332]MDA8467745.1 cytochrome oxidase small assembly protein [Acidovorax sp. GBBC 3299]WCM77766.1 cytochrome oxidase small assembly protein [Acidovorax sp. GBBC 712]